MSYETKRRHDSQQPYIHTTYSYEIKMRQDLHSNKMLVFIFWWQSYLNKILQYRRYPIIWSWRKWQCSMHSLSRWTVISDRLFDGSMPSCCIRNIWIESIDANICMSPKLNIFSHYKIWSTTQHDLLNLSRGFWAPGLHILKTSEPATS